MSSGFAGFALLVAIVAKCEEKIFLAQKKHHLAKTSGEKKNLAPKKLATEISPFQAV